MNKGKSPTSASRAYMPRASHVEYETPDEIFRPLDDEFAFTLDVAANDDNARCAAYFDIINDGLKQAWHGSVWCNPPYGAAIRKWVKKAVDELPNCRVIVMLLPARTDTLWFHNYVYGKAEIRFIKGRLYHKTAHPAPFPSMIVIYRNRRLNWHM